MKRLLILIPLLLMLLGLTSRVNVPTAHANQQVVIDFYYSPTCPHCHEEWAFLDQLGDDYQQTLKINRYIAAQEPYRSQLYNKLEAFGVAEAFGSVPITIINDTYYVLGFDSPEGRGQQILALVDQEITRLGLDQSAQAEEEISQTDINKTVSLPFIGTINTDEHSLFGLALLMGFLDGFNVCSLGALVMILALVMSLRSRKMIATFGGLFILTTAIIYGLLIVAWYHLFDALAPYISSLELVIGLLALGGAAYFFKEYWRIRKLGPACEAGDNRLISSATKKIQKAFEDKRNIWVLGGAVLSFAAVVTIVEFPCSAAVPVVFAGVLADAGLSTLGYLGYISTFVFFYMLDELIIFAVSVYKMDIWLTSPKFSKWFALAESGVLASLGLYYLLNLL